MSFDSALAVPPISKKQDFICALEVYGTRVTPELDAKVDRKVIEITKRAEHLFNKKFKVIWGYGIYQPETAGVTFPEYGLIFFNQLYLNKYREQFIETVVRHEIAHTVSYHLYGDKGDSHGREWKFVMRSLGDNNPKQYHSYTFCAEDNGRIKLPAL